MADVRCFWVEPAGMEARWLRRYAGREGTQCPASHGYHNAMVPIEPAPYSKDALGGKGDFADDPRWPTHCPCGYEFVEADNWQVFRVDIYRAEDGREWPIRELPPGAMYDATWYHDHPNCVGPDGIALVVILPPNGGDDYWHVDGGANNNPAPQGWSRSGTVKGPNPTVTANPSILTPRYHGWLRNGVLVAC
jgi:hypothetical protein